MKHNRRSIRLKGYDYAQAGAYFVTICTQNRECLFGDVVDGKMALNDGGRIVANEWERTAAIRREIELNKWVVMPNHLHGIIVIADNVGAHGRAPLPDDAPCNVPTSTVFTRPPKSLGSLIAGFKSAVTKRINELRKTPGALIWQRNYYEHIIRDERSLNRIREYIANNPAQWDTDRENPNLTGVQPRARTNNDDMPWEARG